MKSATLGAGGPTISRIGIGGWQAGGSGPWGAGPQANDDDAIATIRRAVEGGVTWVDTAASYGLGHSEEIVRRALTPWRVGDDVLVFTKCGHPWAPPDRIWTELRPDSIRRECEGSLRRLGVERIDLYQFHHADPTTPLEDSWVTMADLIEEGKVRWAGVSNFGVDLLERCEAVRHLDSVQPELNLLRPHARRDVIAWARDHGAGVLAYSPLASGVLANVNTADELRAFPEDDWRHVHADGIVGVTEALSALADRTHRDLVSLAVEWTLSVDGVTAAICGARVPRQVDGWIGAGDEVLDTDSRAELDVIGDRFGLS